MDLSLHRHWRVDSAPLPRALRPHSHLCYYDHMYHIVISWFYDGPSELSQYIASKIEVFRLWIIHIDAHRGFWSLQRSAPVQGFLLAIHQLRLPCLPLPPLHHHPPPVVLRIAMQQLLSTNSGHSWRNFSRILQNQLIYLHLQKTKGCAHRAR